MSLLNKCESENLEYENLKKTFYKLLISNHLYTNCTSLQGMFFTGTRKKNQFIHGELYESLLVEARKELSFWTTSMSIYLFQHSLIVTKTLVKILKSYYLQIKIAWRSILISLLSQPRQ